MSRRGGTGTATRGQRVALVSTEPTVSLTGDIYVVGRMPLKHGNHTLPPGVEVPDVDSWPRKDGWINARRIRRVTPGEEFVAYADYVAAHPLPGETEPDADPALLGPLTEAEEAAAAAAAGSTQESTGTE